MKLNFHTKTYFPQPIHQTPSPLLPSYLDFLVFYHLHLTNLTPLFLFIILILSPHQPNHLLLSKTSQWILLPLPSILLYLPLLSPLQPPIPHPLLCLHLLPIILTPWSLMQKLVFTNPSFPSLASPNHHPLLIGHKWSLSNSVMLLNILHGNWLWMKNLLPCNGIRGGFSSTFPSSQTCWHQVDLQTWCSWDDLALQSLPCGQRVSSDP